MTPIALTRPVSSLVFRRLRDNDVDAAVAILAAAAAWLLARGIRQWTTTDPDKLRHELRDDGERYGLFENDQLVAIVTLTGAPPEWEPELRGHDVRWISKLAVAPDCHGRGFGRRMAEHALEQLRREGAPRAWLDCRSGPLVPFYEALGFERVTSKVVDFATGPLDLVLMKRELLIEPMNASEEAVTSARLSRAATRGDPSGP